MLPNCPSCEDNNVTRLPSSFNVVKKDRVKRQRKVGEVTKEYIEAAREDLKEWKGELQTAEYKEDD